MSPFEWLEDLKKSGYFEAYEKRRFQGKLEVIGDEENKTFTVSRTWTDKMDRSGEIFIPAEGIKQMYSKILKLEQEGFKEKREEQIYPP